MARQSMGDTKKSKVAGSAKAKTTTARTTTKKAVEKKPVKAAAAKKTVSKSASAKQRASVLEIADHAIHPSAKPTVVKTARQPEHWHAGIFALMLIIAAYYSYQYSNALVINEPVNNVPVNTVAVVDEEEAPVEPTVLAFNFPNDYAWLTQSVSDDLTIAPGASGEYTIQVRNSGRATWYRDADAAFRLGTLSPADVASPFVIASVMADGGSRPAPNRNRIEMMQPQVAPGETAIFKVAATAKDWDGNDLRPGTYRLTVGFMVETEGSLSKQPLTWLLNVR